MWGHVKSLAQRSLCRILSLRPIPEHIAFIMDGNRRFAEERNIDRWDGHSLGYDSLLSALHICLLLGVRCVSVYAFSIENYSRNEKEVSSLMNLAAVKLRSLIDDLDILSEKGVRVNILGDLLLAPSSVQSAAKALMTATARNRDAVLNICFSYTFSRDLEHALHAAKCSHKAQGNGHALETHKHIKAENSHSVTGVQLPTLPFEDHLSTAGCPDVDMLIRTSGEQRFSDFLLWQSRNALLVFTPVLWPEFGIFDLCSAILEYQKHHSCLMRIRATCQHVLLSEPLIETHEYRTIKP